MQSIEDFWEDILSQDSERIFAAISMLDALTHQEVIRHLKLMTVEPGWHPAQMTAAFNALSILANFNIARGESNLAE